MLTYSFHLCIEGETCCGDEFKAYSAFIKNQLDNDVYIKAVQIGSSERSDRLRSMTMHPFEQVFKLDTFN